MRACSFRRARSYSRISGRLPFRRSMRDHTDVHIRRSIQRSEKLYGDRLDEFNPDRFLNKQAQDPRQYIFGYGRRYVHLDLLR